MNFFIFVGASLLVERVGRRVLFVTSNVGMLICLSLLAYFCLLNLSRTILCFSSLRYVDAHYGFIPDPTWRCGCKSDYGNFIRILSLLWHGIHSYARWYAMYFISIAKQPGHFFCLSLYSWNFTIQYPCQGIFFDGSCLSFWFRVHCKWYYIRLLYSRTYSFVLLWLLINSLTHGHCKRSAGNMWACAIFVYLNCI